MIRQIVIAAALAAAFAGSAEANTWSNGIHYTSSATASCPTLTGCTINFPEVTGSKPLQIREISCEITTSPTSVITRVQLGQTKGYGWWAWRAYPRAEIIFTGSTRRYGIQQSMYYVVAAGNQPSLHINVTPASAEFTMTCSLYGNRI